MSSYENFAKVYDIMMEDIPYQEWVEYIELIMKKNNCHPKLMLDLGCGTGNITTLLAQKGYDMIGIDNSADMLSIAKSKAKDHQVDILYLLQDMRLFELYGTVGCIISLCDSLNYITEEKDLLEVFKLVNNYLDPSGLFIFDLNTEYKFKENMTNHTFAETYDDCAYIWDNYYYEDEKINEYLLTLFIKDDKNNYNRYEEIHYEKAYSIDKIKHLLDEAGLKLESVYDEGSFNKPKATSTRIYFVAREQQKAKGEYINE